MSRDTKYWDNFYLNLARIYASASKDPSTQVGAIIIDNDRRIVSTGYNGFAKNIEDKEERLNNRDLKYALTIHAEANALLYTNVSLENCTIFTWPFMPCSSCASMIIQKGIKRVVSLKNENPRWFENFSISKEIFLEAKVDLILYDSILPIFQEQV